MALRAVIDHPKFAALKARLGTTRGATLGYLEAVWHFTGRFTPHGNLGKYSDAEIEGWVEWDGEQGALIGALVACRWIDADDVHRLVVHDWRKHCDDATKLAVKRSKMPFIGAQDEATLSLKCPDVVDSPPIDHDDSAPTLSLQCPDSVATTSPDPPQSSDYQGQGQGQYQGQKTPPSPSLPVKAEAPEPCASPRWFEGRDDGAAVVGALVEATKVKGGKTPYAGKCAESHCDRFWTKWEGAGGGLDDFADLMAEWGQWHERRSSDKAYTDPMAAMRNWFLKREPDLLRRKVARDRSVATAKSVGRSLEGVLGMLDSGGGSA